MEMENENENENHHKSVQQITHRFHRRHPLVQQTWHPFHMEHPLVLVAEQSNEGLKAHCDGCGELLSAPCFTCIHCNYHLHKQCAEAPLSLPNHPLHPECSPFGSLLRQRPYPFSRVYGCVLCKEKQSPMAIDVLKRLNCCWCHEPLTDDIYLCPDCPSFIIHKKCLDELPTKINHPSHHIHPLLLNYSDSYNSCNLCQKGHSGAFYGCSLCSDIKILVIGFWGWPKIGLYTLCHFNINLECALLRSVIEEKRSHQHPFSLLWRQGSFICDACDTEGNYISYICLKCYIVVHKKCISLPRIIKFSRHAHCIFHKYFLQTQELTKQDCKICFKEVRLERGSYSCGKLGCNYVVHVNCVLEDGDLYEVIEDEKQCEELYEKSMQSSTIRVIEVNEAREATKIQHLSHQHCLVLADKMEEEIDRKCDGCMLPISNIFYYCSECPFFLHKTCAELPRIKQHWFRQSNATLNFDSFKKCDFCSQYSSGFFYDINEDWDMCLRGKCNGCGETNRRGAFRCGKCRFALDFGCLTLPHSALHKIDEHKLKLTYHDDNEQSYCDICEQYRDPSLWKVEGYPECSYCGKLCQEEILKCEESTCNYIVHYKCHWRH
ncbi:hypothetical protein E1A91_D06G212000v1 [Gossypium mustelinum]|uniref:Phorbol-ester/DAG-type domain-containing protein n=1 Tax=Gossypium mustelinum TaxID=34275 RepID=A0A5D2ULV0_GOSMU|nr:hypothetical protein E1A91_D06G212000v1 [Gossypium mustelinum]